MDKNALDRLRQLAGNAPREQYTADNSRQNMYQIRDKLTESSEKAEKVTWSKGGYERGAYWAQKSTGGGKGFDSKEKRDAYVKTQNSKVEESSAVDRARYDADGKSDKSKTEGCDPKFSDEELAKQAREEKIKLKPGEGDPKKYKTESDMMREWANSVYQQYDDAGTVQEQPNGETVDLSLRNYLNAQPQKVQIEENIQAGKLLREYRSFKRK